MSLLTEVISNAHMAGQHHAGCSHPSWGDALGHTHTILPETLDRAARQHINEAEQTPTNREIAAEMESWADSHTPCASPMGGDCRHVPQAVLYRWARHLRNA